MPGTHTVPIHVLHVGARAQEQGTQPATCARPAGSCWVTPCQALCYTTSRDSGGKKTAWPPGVTAQGPTSAQRHSGGRANVGWGGQERPPHAISTQQSLISKGEKS